MSIETYRPIAQLSPSKYVKQVFLVESVEAHPNMKTHTGVPFAKVTLRDVSGKIEGIVWEYDNSLSPHTYVNMQIETRRNKNGQIDFHTQPKYIFDKSAPIPINQHDYVLSANPNTLQRVAATIEQAIGEINDQDYLSIMSYAAHRVGLINSLMESPYGLSGATAYRGGLLMHTRRVLTLALASFDEAEEFETNASKSLVIAGSILRNIGWHTTTFYQGAELRARDALHIVGVGRSGARYIDHLFLSYTADTHEDISESKKQALENCVKDSQEISTFEGKLIAAADITATIIETESLRLKTAREGNWKGDLFVGHQS